jgi:UDP-glucuronate decarboxylase
MSLLNNNLYLEDIEGVASFPFDWSKLKNTTILISGASGMIGSFLIDLIMYRNKIFGDNCSIFALGRNKEKANVRFNEYLDNNNFSFISHDINIPLTDKIIPKKVDYIIHAASNTHPMAYALDPIGTVTTNIIGTNNLLSFATIHSTKRFVFTSSVEIYGENRGDTEKFTEDYCGYIDCNTLRAGYPESKRAGEALCQAYIKQKGLDIVIPRLSRTYGPTMLMSDTKAISQFIKKGTLGEDIILKSEGTQNYSYCYVADAVSGILATLFNGKCGEAYNLSDDGSDITLRDLANIVANFVKKKVIFEIPDAIESSGYSKATKALLDSSKLNAIGWKASYNIRIGLERTIKILK